MADVEQWVNLIRHTPHDDGDADNPIAPEQQGRTVRFRVRFRKSEFAHANVRVVPDEAIDKIHHASKEQHYPRFRLEEGRTRVVTVAGEDFVETEAHLPAMGGNGYVLQAKTKKSEKQSAKKAVGRRRVYFVALDMESHPELERDRESALLRSQGKDVFIDKEVLRQTLIDRYWNVDKKLYIHMSRAPSSRAGDVPFRVIDLGDERALSSVFRELRPWLKKLKTLVPGFAMLFVDQIAHKKYKRHSVPIDLSSSGENWSYDPESQVLNVLFNEWLWWGFSDEQDKQKHWMVEVSVVTNGAAGQSNVALDVPKSAVELGGRHGTGYKSIRVHLAATGRVLGDIRNHHGKFKLVCRMRHVSEFANGVSFGRCNVVFIAQRVEWEARQMKHVKSTCIHEAGHRVGLVPSGKDPQFLAASGKHDDKHRGHCATESCVMYYQAGGIRGDQFCEDCLKDLRRTDVSWESGVYGRNIA